MSESTDDDEGPAPVTPACRRPLVRSPPTSASSSPGGMFRIAGLCGKRRPSDEEDTSAKRAKASSTASSSSVPH
eukprot:8600804-Pyramimonas_sp.AAC.1